MKVLDLFSGIGGFSIGLEKADLKQSHFAKSKNTQEQSSRDIGLTFQSTVMSENLQENNLEQMELFQTSSSEGIPASHLVLPGTDEARKMTVTSGLKCAALLKKSGPAWCIFENVAGHITMGIDEVLSDLEAENYSARPFVIPACGVDAPHRRDRVWIVAHTQINRNRRTSRQGEEANGEVSKRDDSGVANQSSEVCSTLAYSNRNDGRRERSTEPQGQVHTAGTRRQQ